MIYFDNAATTKYKPDDVYEAFDYYVKEIGVSPGRGSYSLGIEASRMLYQCRKVVCEYFGVGKSTNVVFTKNSTEAINLFFRGFLNKGDHVVITPYEHNAVLRPLHLMKEEGVIDYSVISREDLKEPAEYVYKKYFRDNTVVFASTLASNLTGRMIINLDFLKYFHDKGITNFIDSSQGAGKIRLNMQKDYIDYLAFTGHKDLMALPGVGGLCCSEYKIKPLIQGGTGIHGDTYINPSVYPEGLEAGTLNMPAIWSLKAALDYLMNNWDSIQNKYIKLQDYFISKIGSLSHIIIYDKDEKCVPTFGINIDGISSDRLVRILDEKGICVRGGIHCAILAHESLNTVNQGIVRISLGYFNTEDEIDSLFLALKTLEA